MKEQHIDKIWTSDFIRISLTQLLLFTVFYALLTTLPIYVTSHLGESQSSAGLVVTCMLISAILIRPFTAKIMDIYGKKRTLVWSIVLFTITTFFYLWMNSLIPLLTLRFIHGISFGLLTTATSAIVVDTIPARRRGAGMGYFAMAMNLAIVMGPFIALTLLQYVSFQTLFIVLNVFMLISVYCAVTVHTKEKAPEETHTESPFKLNLHDLIEVKAIPVGIISGLVGFAYASILSFVSVHAEELGLASTASYFFLVFAIVMILFRPYLGRAFDEKGAKVVLIPSLFIFALGLMILGFTTTSFMLLVAAGFIGLGYGTLLPGFQTLSIQSTTTHRSGYAVSTFFIFYDLGIATGAFVWGQVVAGMGFGSMYFLSSLLVVATSILFYILMANKEKKAKKVYAPAHVDEEIV